MSSNNNNNNYNNDNSLIKEDSIKNEVTVITPKCSKCDLIASGLFYEFYKDPTFSPYTEVMSSIFWTRIWFVCPKCYGTIKMSDQEVDKLNSYPLDKINFPPGFDSKKMKVQRMMSK